MTLPSILLLIFTTFGISTTQNSQHFIRFYKIDNSVKVFANDSLVYKSELIDGNPDMSLDVPIEYALVKGINNIRVELYNGSELNDFKSDTSWEIRYEIFDNDVSIDYMHQFSKNGTEGLAFEYLHEIYKK